MPSPEQPQNTPEFSVLSHRRLTEGMRYWYNLAVSYDHLVGILGAPLEGDGDHTDAEWYIQTQSGISTIYNWNSGRNFLGEAGKDVSDIASWHVGAVEQETAKELLDIILPCEGVPPQEAD